METNILTFGNFKGKSFEWVFFNAPWYAHWLYRKRALSDNNGYDGEDRAYFDELYRRAVGLKGVCAKCRERPLSRIDIGDLVGENGKGTVGLYCNECHVEHAELHCMLRPSFFAVEKRVPRCSQKTIARAIHGHFIGNGNLTQAKMEKFFRTDDFFQNATLGFFRDQGEEVKR